ncbi:MAG: DUF4288 domain-containing protein [Flavobacteriales bacterium]|nr:DUF4288 domain-containing protein [Flavobacteriales bacterium]
MDTEGNKWFAVKLVYVNEVIGKPDPKLVDNNFKENYVAYEESVVLIKAKSFDEAYVKSEKIGKENEDDYTNIYGQTVQQRLVGEVDCFELLDEPLENGTELYSNIIETSTGKSHGHFISETFKVTTDMQYMLMNAAFNKQKN